MVFPELPRSPACRVLSSGLLQCIPKSEALIPGLMRRASTASCAPFMPPGMMTSLKRILMSRSRRRMLSASRALPAVSTCSPNPSMRRRPARALPHRPRRQEPIPRRALSEEARGWSTGQFALVRSFRQQMFHQNLRGTCVQLRCSEQAALGHLAFAIAVDIVSASLGRPCLILPNIAFPVLCESERRPVFLRA
jgi:hypothetical protein